MGPRLRLIAPAAGCDCRTCAFFTGNPKAVEPICSGCNTDCAYCGCARAGGGSKCARCPIRCGSRVDIAAWMADVGGTLAFDDVVLGLELPARLPAFVPQVDGGDLATLDAGLEWPAYALGLRRVISPKTLAVYPRFAGRSAAEGMGLRPGQLVVCLGFRHARFCERLAMDQLTQSRLTGRSSRARTRNRALPPGTP